MSASTNKGYELQTTGTNYGTWGQILNANFDIIDLNFGGRVVKDVSGSSNITVTTDEAQNVFHKLTGTITGNILYILPNAGSFYFIQNATTGAFTITIVSDALGAGVVVPQGSTVMVFVDATDTTVQAAINYLGAILAVANGGTGLSSYTIGDIIYASGATTLSTLADVATGNALISGGVGVAPTWGKVDLTTAITGNLPITNLNSGTLASETTFWCGDGTWKVPPSSTAPVTSVNGQTGVVVLTKSDISLGNVQNVDQTVASNITSGIIGTAILGSGSATSSTFLRGDQTWASAGVITTAGAVGTYAMAVKTGSGTVAYNGTVSASNLSSARVESNTSSPGFIVVTSSGANEFSGTWRNVSFTAEASSNSLNLWLRIA